ncbi:MAG: PD40 domain-containing protein [Saprospiraceae bacterium]|nr:PD40 domain-containing protein [Saprospiraceae bacterium]
MQHLFILLITCLYLHAMDAQAVVSLETVSTKFRKKFDQAQTEYKNGQLEKARNSFSKIIQQFPDFIDAQIQLASVCYELNDYTAAAKHFETALKLDSFYKIKVYYTLAIVQYKLERFARAKANMEVFISKESSNIDLLSKAKTLYKKISFAADSTNYNFEIQQKRIAAFYSDFSEYMPSIQADGKLAYFTRRSPRGDEDIFYAIKQDTTWSMAVPLDVINTPLNEGSPSISADGKLLVFTSCDRREGLGGCDLYFSEWDGNQWSNPRNFGEQINTPAYESQACISNNGRTLHFVSNRKGTLGGTDIWFSHKKQDGKWTTPKNIGEPINTTGDDVSPFLHSNGITLYFASDGHTGMGGKDLFVSTLDSNNHWSQVNNLGYPPNSIGDESSWIVLPNGKTAWMASDHEYLENNRMKANLDLYEIPLPASMQVVAATYVKIKIQDKSTKIPLQAEVKIYNLSTQKLMLVQKADVLGQILFSVPAGSDYAIQVQHDLYNLYTEQFLCNEPRSVYRPLLLNVDLSKLQESIDVQVVLKNIFFETGSDVLLPASKFELDALYKILKSNNKLKILIEGHTDNVGEELDNQLLSTNRAQAVVNYLLTKGITADRLEAKGQGESKPISDNNSEEGRRLNRRIEFTIID